MQNRVCVCVPTYRRSGLVRECLRYLSALSPPPETDLFFLLVDNDKEESAKPSFDAAIKDFSFPINYVVQSEKGIPYARNLGIDEARKMGSTHILYVDDDMRVPPDYLCELMAGMAESECDAIRGKMIIVREDTTQKIPRHASLLSRRDMLPTNGVLISEKIFTGMALRFDERFVRGSEDGDFFYRAYLRGAKLILLENVFFFEYRPDDRAPSAALKDEISRAFRSRRTRAAIRRYRGGLGRGLLYVGRRGAPLLLQCIGHIVLLPLSPKKTRQKNLALHSANRRLGARNVGRRSLAAGIGAAGVVGGSDRIRRAFCRDWYDVLN